MNVGVLDEESYRYRAGFPSSEARHACQYILVMSHDFGTGHDVTYVCRMRFFNEETVA
jgi:hypothetical protein